MQHLKLVSFTERGAQLAKLLSKQLAPMQVERYARTVDKSLSHTLLSRFTQQAMYDCNAIIFIGATGIAVRAISKHMRDKSQDPAVLVIDESGKFVIPLISGHIGGANKLANIIAQKINATAVITTATDVNGAFAVDVFAVENDLTVHNIEKIRSISGDILRGNKVGFVSENVKITGKFPVEVTQDMTQSGFVISHSTKNKPYKNTLHLIPKNVVAGIGCRRGKSLQDIENALKNALNDNEIPMSAISKICSIDVKKDEVGLLQLSRKYNVDFKVFTAEELNTAKGEFSSSSFVSSTVGVDNVCERKIGRAHV